MKLADYLREIEYAGTRVIDAIWHEREEADTLRKEIEALRNGAAENYSRARHIQETAEDADDVMLGVGIHWDTYFGEDKDQHYKTKDLESLEVRLKTREFSVSSLSGTLLQFAKQGLSAAFGKPANWPTGRSIGSQVLKTFILEGRNQSEHWEEGTPHPPVQQCFTKLTDEVGLQFCHYKTKNLAFEVVSMLGWRSFEDFRNDLLSMRNAKNE
jgi:hypothetical protein